MGGVEVKRWGGEEGVWMWVWWGGNGWMVDVVQGVGYTFLKQLCFRTQPYDGYAIRGSCLFCFRITSMYSDFGIFTLTFVIFLMGQFSLYWNTRSNNIALENNRHVPRKFKVN